MAGAGTWLIAIGQLGLCAGLLACYIIAPRLVQTAESGVSNYGAHSSTIIPYSLAFLVAGVCTALAGHIAMRSAVRLAVALYALGALYVAALFSTYFYQQGQDLRNIHIAVGGALYGVQLLLGLWYVTQTDNPWLAMPLLAVQLAGMALSLISLLGIVHLLLVGQVVTGVGFGLLLVLMANQMLSAS